MCDQNKSIFLKKPWAFILCFTLFLISFPGFGQWNQMYYQAANPGGNYQVFSLFYSADSGVFVGRRNSYLYSSDNAATWSVKTNFSTGASLTMSNTLLLSAYMNNKNSIHICGDEANSSYYGFYSKTADATNNWTCTYPFPYVNSIAKMKSIKFFDVDTGYCFDNNHTLRKTNDGGNTWFIKNNLSFLNSTTDGFTMCMVDKNVGYFVTTQGIQKTVDGGSTVTSVTCPIIGNYGGADVRGISFPSPSVGYFLTAVYPGNYKLFKTIDGGSSWTDLFQGSGFTAQLNDVFFIDNNTGYIAADEFILKTTDGGVTWGIQHFYGKKIVKVFFRNINEGVFAGADLGYSKTFVYKTSNGGGNYKPFGYFYMSNGYCCANQLCNITNLSPLAYSYKWLLDGSLISTSYNPSSQTSAVSGNHTIKLITTNLGVSDTFALNVYSADTLPSSYHITSSFNPALCQNNAIPVNLISPYSNFTYGLYNGTTPISTQYVPPPNYTIYSAPVDTSFILTVMASSPYKLCPGNTIHANYNITVYPQPKIYPISFNDDTLCLGATLNMTLLNTDAGTIYHLFQYFPQSNNSNILQNFTSTGGNASFNYSNTLYSKYFYYTAASPQGCNNGSSSNLNFVDIDSVTAKVSLPNYAFAVHDTISIHNLSININKAHWSFPSSISILDTASSFNAKIYTTASGNFPMTMIAENTHGCRDTSYSYLNVIDTVAQPLINLCSTVNSALVSYPDQSLNNSPATIHVDKNNNTYIGGFNYFTFNINSFFTKMNVIKYDSLGHFRWNNISSSSNPGYDYFFGICNSINTDSIGNVYVAGSISAQNFYLSSSGGCPYSGYPSRSFGFLAKYDSSGNCLWKILSNVQNNYSGACHFGNIEITPYGKIFFENYGSDDFLFGDGITHTTYHDNSIIEINSSGSFIKSIDLPPGSLSYMDPSSSSSMMTILTAGRFKVFGNKIIYYSIAQLINPNHCVSLLDKAGVVHQLCGNNLALPSSIGYIYITDTAGNYINFYKTFEYIYDPAFHNTYNGQYPFSSDNGHLTIDKSGNIYTTFSPCPAFYPRHYEFHGHKYLIPGENEIDSLGKMSIIQKWDMNGNELHHNFIGFTDIKGLVANADNNLYGIANYSKFLSFSSTNGHSYGLTTGNDSSTNAVLFSYLPNGNFNWFKTLGSSKFDNAGDIVIKDTCNADIYFAVTGQDTLKWNNYSAPAINQYQIFKFNPNGSCSNNPCVPPPLPPITIDVREYSNTNSTIKIFPNPSNDNIEVEIRVADFKNEITNYKIYNSIGSIVSCGVLKNNSISIKNLENGIYHIQLIYKQQILNASFVKIK